MSNIILAPRTLYRCLISSAAVVLLTIALPQIAKAQFELDFICSQNVSVDAAMIGTVDSVEATILIPGDTSLIDSILVEIVVKGNPVFWDSTIITTSAGEVVVVHFPGLITNTGSNEEAAIYRAWVGPAKSITATTPVVDPLHYNDWQSMTTWQIRSDFDCVAGGSSDGDILLFHACDTFHFNIDSVTAPFKDVSIIAPLSEIGDADTVRSAIVEVNYIHEGVRTDVSIDTFYGNDNLGNNALLYEKIFSVPGYVDSIEIVFISPDGVFSNTSCSQQFPFGGDSFVVGTILVSADCEECCIVDADCGGIDSDTLCAFDLVPALPEVLLDSAVSYSGNINLDSLAFAEIGGSYVTTLCDTIYIIGIDEITGEGCPGDTGYVVRSFIFFSLSSNNAVDTCSVIYTVLDSLSPIISCPTDTILQCSLESYPPYASLDEFIAAGGVASDDCRLDSASFTLISEISDGLICPQTIIRTYSIADSCGNPSTCIQQIMLIDTIPPSLTCPDDLTLECLESTDPDITGFAILNDDCDPDPALTYSDVVIAGLCNVEFTVVRTWTGSDTCGNIVTCVQTIVVEDNAAPQLTVPDDATIQCGDEATGVAMAIDNCTEVVLTYIDLQCAVTVEGFTGDYDFANWTAVEPNGGDVTTTDTTEVTLTGPNGVGCNGLSTVFSIVIPADGKLIFAWDYSTNDTDGPSFDPFGYNVNGTFVQLTNDAGGDTQSGLAAALVSAGDVFAFEQNSTDCIFGEAATTVIDFFVFTCTEDEPVDQCNYTVFRCWSATDECGNTAYGLQRIQVADTEPPIITCPGNLTLECTESTDPADTGFATATDNCDADVDVTYTDLVAGICPYIIVRTWIAIDSCDNVAMCVQMITVDDSTPPTINCPPDGSFECGSGTLTYTTLEAFIEAGGSVSDNCGLDSASFTLSEANVVGPCPSVFTFVYLVTDLCGNSATCAHLVTVSDDIPPVIDCPDDESVQCSIEELSPYESLTDFLEAGGAVSDNCGLDSLSFTLVSQVSDNLTCPETITRTYSIADVCGNASTCIQQIVVNDTIAPALTCPEDVTLECLVDTDPNNIGFAIVNDNCDTDPELTYSDILLPGLCDVEFTIIRTWAATDTCGNVATCVQTIVVEDNAAPQLTVPDDATIQCGDEATGVAIAIDNCTEVVLTYIDLQCAVTVEGFTGDYDFANWTAVEPNGGDVTTTDTTEVTLTGPNGVGCNGLSTIFSIVIPADGKLIFAWDYSTNDTDGPSYDPFGYTINGTFVQLTNDAGGDTQSGLAAALVSAGDVFAFEQNSTDCIFGEAATTVIDFFVFTCTEDEPSDPCNYTVFRCWSATDECGNTAYGLQRIQVADTEPPNITCPGNLTLECTESTDPADTGFATATDNCDADVDVTYTDLVAGICPYIIVRTWIAIDSCENVAMCVQMITVDDSTAPTINCPPDGNFECGSGALSYATLEAFIEAGGSVSDNCGLDSASFTLSEANVVGPCPSVFTYVYVVTDLCGNSATCAHLVTVSDDIPPVIDCPESEALQCSVDELPPYGSLTDFVNAGGIVSDNCALDSLSFTLLAEVSDGLTCPETIIRTYSIEDLCGNVGTCEQTIIVDDTVPPVITCSADITIECSDPVPPGTASATDNCDSDPTILPASSITPGDCPGEFIIFRSWIATDECGNTALCEQIVTIVDTTPPEISCPADVTWECDESTDPLNTGFASATDNCDVAPSVDYDDISEPGACLTITRIWTATDNCGNTATCVQVITVEDTTPPTIICPDDTTIECDESSDPANTGNATATDFCDPVLMIEYSDVAGPGICYTITRTWTATDDCGNSTSCVQFISVDDTTVPLIDCPPDVTLGSSESTDPSETGVATTTDNCDPSPSMTYVDHSGQGDCAQGYAIIRVWTATDACGNSAQCTQTLTIDDDPPVPVCLASVVVSLDLMGMTVIPAEAFDGGSSDECGPVYFKVKRMTPPVGFDCYYDGNSLYQFDDYIKFCCEDIGNENLMIILRVYDVEPIPGIVPDDYLLGHFADCMLEVEVQDKVPPQIECPSDLTISCEFDFDPDNLTVFGDVVTDPADQEQICIDDPGNPYTDGLTCIGLDGLAIDNCSVTVTDTAIIDLNMCGTGLIRRIFTATDANGLTATCEQEILVVDYTPFDSSNITWPQDFMTTDICQIDLLDPEDLSPPYDYPIVEDDECSLVTFTNQDIVFDFSNSQQACFKILRRWTVLDWCQYQVGGGSGIWTYTQVIKVHNTVGPEIALAEEVLEICTDDPACGPGNVTLEASAEDDCSGPEALRWTVRIDEDDNGSYDQSFPGIIGAEVQLDVELPLGTHRVLYSVEDFCGNNTTEEQFVTVLSCKPPSAKCRNLVTTLMPMDTDGDQIPDWGMVILQADDLDAGSDHACGNPIHLAFSPDTADVSMLFDCDDLGENQVQLWVIDDNGNTDFCTVTITIQDNFDVCPENVEQQAVVRGTIATADADMVPNVEVDLVGSNLPVEVTDDLGQYAFPPMPHGGAYVIAPLLNTEHKKGVSTIDLIVLQKHLLGLEPLNSPYKFIAGDANRSETLSAMDVVVLRRLILGMLDTIPNNTSWRFVDAGYQFADPANPLAEDYPETYLIDPLSSDMEVNFIAVKVGDINGSVMNLKSENEIQTRSDVSRVPMYLNDQFLKTGETRTIQVRCKNLASVQGMQFTLRWDPEVLEVSPAAGSAALGEGHWNPNRLELGMLPVSWTIYDIESGGLPEELLTLRVSALQDALLSEAGLSIDSEITQMEGVLTTGQRALPELTILPVQDVDKEFAVYQNRPNPFDRKTMIPVISPEQGLLTLEVFNAEGKLVYVQKVNAVAGYNEFILDREVFQVQGVYTYKVSTTSEYRTLRMIVVDE